MQKIPLPEYGKGIGRESRFRSLFPSPSDLSSAQDSSDFITFFGKKQANKNGFFEQTADMKKFRIFALCFLTMSLFVCTAACGKTGASSPETPDLLEEPLEENGCPDCPDQNGNDKAPGIPEDPDPGFGVPKLPKRRKPGFRHPVKPVPIPQPKPTL